MMSGVEWMKYQKDLLGGGLMWMEGIRGDVKGQVGGGNQKQLEYDMGMVGGGEVG